MTEIAQLTAADPVLAERVRRLSPGQRTLLDALLRVEQDAAAPAQRPVRPRPSGATEIPLSFAQQRLWFVDQLQPGNPAYNCPIAVRLRGELDLRALHAALSGIVARHESMRTTFGSRDGQPHQVVWPATDVDLAVLDLTGLPEAEREAELARYVREDGGTAFDLATGPVMRTSLVAMSERDHVLLMNIHHIVTDGWSMRVFYEELAELYRAHHAGTEPRLAPLAVQYPDFSLWEQEYLVGDAIETDLRYWRTQLDRLPALDLPTDRPHPPVAGADGAVEYFRLAEQDVAGLTELGRDEQSTLFMTMLAAFYVLLGRYSGQTDLAVSTSVSGRPQTSLESLIGFFVNTVVLRGSLDGDPTFRELVGRVRETTLGAFAHQNVPFERLVEELAPVRDPGRIPLAPVIFLMDSTPDEGPQLDGLDVEPVEHDAGTAKFDLLLSVRVTGGRLRARVQYRTDLFDHDTIERLIGHYRTLLGEIVADPDRPVSRIPMLTAEESAALLVEPNDTAAPFPDRSCLHELVAEQARRTPDAVAVATPGGPISYAELDGASARLAGLLAERGVGPGDRVGLVLRRTPDLLTAILGVLRAGAAYVPLDPSYPAERLAFMIDDAKLAHVLTETAVRDAIPETGVGVTDLTACAAELAARAPAAGAPVSPTDIAYVIYTSGSTGTPKGIELAHRGVVNNLTDLNRRHGIGPGDSCLALSSPSFDMCVYETLGMLTCGGTVVLPDPDQIKSPAHWADLLWRNRVTVWNSAPSLLGLLVEHLELDPVDREPVDVSTLRVAWLGGDWIPVPLPDRIRRYAPSMQVVALGGATESSIHSIIFPVGEVDPEWTSIPYGRPMANQQAYILDDAMQPVPVGVRGELHLAGVGLARGYLDRPELTAEKFVTWEGNRLYRTGDVARWRRDGTIELIGRKDFLVKVNGLRIELGEIEATLREHDGLADAVVAAVTDAAGDRRIVGYLVAADPAAAPEAADVRHFLEDRLPSYMVPPVLLFLDAVPTSPNGKVDRKALPDPSSFAPGSGAGPAGGPPRTEAERHVVAVWAEGLAIDPDAIGIDDDFFALGGDSFKAIRVAQRVRPGMPVVELFKSPTPRRLAHHLETEPSGRPARMLHRLTRDDAGEPELTFVCVPYGGGSVIAYQPLADRLPPRIALWSVALPGHDLGAGDELKPRTETARMIADEVADRLTGPIALWGQCAGSALTVELAGLLEERGVELENVYVGAVLPDDDAAANVERCRVEGGPGEAFYAHMRGLGGFDGALDDSNIEAILGLIWHDMEQAAHFFHDADRNPPRPLTTPMRLVIGDADPATVGYQHRYREWNRFFDSVELAVIPGAGHYFVKHDAAELARILETWHEPRIQGGS